MIRSLAAVSSVIQGHSTAADVESWGSTWRRDAADLTSDSVFEADIASDCDVSGRDASSCRASKASAACADVGAEGGSTSSHFFK